MHDSSIDLDELKLFLMLANTPHAQGTAKIHKEKDGSRTIEFTKGDYRMHDNFFGGEPYGGRLVVFYKEEPIFIEVYYGKTSKPADEVYDFLREALQHPSYDNPFRGPAEYKKRPFTYKSMTQGGVSDHIVNEYIYEDNEEIYSAIVIGGLVDRKAKGSM
jgi:hypothetical protein